MALNQLSFKVKRNASLENVCFERSWFVSIYLFPFTLYTCPLCDLYRIFSMLSDRMVWLHFGLFGVLWIVSPWLLVQACLKTWGSVISMRPQSVLFWRDKAWWAESHLEHPQREGWHLQRWKMDIRHPVFSGNKYSLLPSQNESQAILFIAWCHVYLWFIIMMTRKC